MSFKLIHIVSTRCEATNKVEIRKVLKEVVSIIKDIIQIIQLQDLHHHKLHMVMIIHTEMKEEQVDFSIVLKQVRKIEIVECQKR